MHIKHISFDYFRSFNNAEHNFTDCLSLDELARGFEDLANVLDKARVAAADSVLDKRATVYRTTCGQPHRTRDASRMLLGDTPV